MIRRAQDGAAANMLPLTVDGAIVMVAVRKSPRARRLTLRVRHAEGDAVLTIPPRVTLQQARRFAEKHVGWLQSRLSALPTAIAFMPGAVIPVRDVPHLLVHRTGARGLAGIEGQDGRACLAVPGGPEHFARRVSDYLKKQARTDLEGAVDRHSVALGVRTTGLRLGDPVSRWGSCSSRGSLSFSWRLVMAPPFVLDYLAAHEVAHRREMNHGTRFWAVVEQLCPDFRTAEHWIKRHGAGLHRYGGAGGEPDDSPLP